MGCLLPIIFCISICVLCCGISFKVYHKIWNPIMMFHLMFLLGILFSYQDETLLNDNLIKSNGFFWLGLGTLIFSVSFYLSQSVSSKLNKQIQIVNYNTTFLNKLINICLVISIVSTIVSSYIVLQIAGDFVSILVDSTAVRDAYLERESQGTLFTILLLFLSINFYTLLCLYPVAIESNCPKVFVKLALVLIFRLLGSIITMSKDAFIVDCIILISAFSVNSNGFEDEKKFLKKYSVYFIFLIFTLLLLIAIQRGYLSQGRYDNYFGAVIGTIKTYISVPITGFNVLISEPSVEECGRQCFRPIVNFFAKLGLVEYSALIQPPIIGSVNVFTMFGNMYNDFGYFGIVFLSLFWGFFFGICYNAYKSNRIRNLVINSIIITILLFGFFDFKIIQTVYLVIMIYAVFFERLIRCKLYKNS